MKPKKKLTKLLVFTILISSCTVTNNLYVNDPVPLGKSKSNAYVGVGSGLTPKIDSISANGNINYSNRLKIAPNLCVSGQYGLGEKTNLALVAHLPYLISGVGLHIGVQYSFFKKESPFNAALGSDFGFVFAKDELVIGNTQLELNPDTKGTLNADVFLPLAYRFNENYRIILTPRMNFYSFSVKRTTDHNNHKTQKYNPIYPSISMGIRLKKIQIEATAQYINNQIVPGFGVAYFWKGINWIY